MATLGGGGPPERTPDTPNIHVNYDNSTQATLIGQGGNADVYRITVEHNNSEIPVAVKQPRLQQTLGSEVVDRFVEEAEVWESLDSHNNIVDIVDWNDKPFPWIAMEYMDGGTLEALTADEELPLEQAIWVGLCVTRAVRHAHRHGVVHYDIKPANVLFRQSANGWMVPKVSDWGLARMMLDETNSVAGLSPQYAAPEQFDSDTYGSPDDHTDIYQVGVLLYELTTGTLPFDGAATSVMQSVLTETPAPPSTVADVPPSVDELILPALKKEKADRYDSIIYLRDGLSDLFESLRNANEDTTGGQPASEPDISGQEPSGSKFSNQEQPKEVNSESQAEHQQNKDSDDTTPDNNTYRREFVKYTGVGVVAAGGAGTGLWWITQQSGSDGGGSVEENDPSTGVPSEIDNYLDQGDAQLYDGTITDYTGQNEVTIDVGAGDVGFAFDPAAVRIDAGTTVIWEWTGQGGQHNVVSVESSESEFSSGNAVSEEGTTFEQSFENTGIQLYQCTPHQANGMLGGIDVQ
jgi:halocyanin-like protein